MQTAYLEESTPQAILTREEERALAERFQDGDEEAGWRLVKAHLRFVYKLAHSFRGYGLRFEDLVQEGNIGLLEAVRRFDPLRERRLISYASHWIRAQMQAYVVQQHSMVRIGTSQVQRRLFYRLRRAEETLRREAQQASARTGREYAPPTDADLAEHLGVSERSIVRMRSRLYGRDASLDAPLHDTELTLGASLPSPEPDPEARLAQAEITAHMRDRIPKLIERELDERERYILNLRLFQERPWTLERIGQTLGITRERTRQLEARAKAKLRRELSDLAPA